MLLITQPRVGLAHHEINALEQAAQELGWQILSAPTGWRLTEELITSKAKGVPYGCQTFCEVIAQQMGWTLYQNSFDWLAKVPTKYLKRKVDFMTLGEAKKITKRKFIKPADDKCFEAKIYEPGEFKPHDCIKNDYPVLVSDVVQWDLEYRIFTDGFKVKTWSNYLVNGHVTEPGFWHMIPEDQYNLKIFADDFLYDMSHITIGRPSVVDVGRIKDKGWAIIETNPVWASGIYGCDPAQVLKVLELSCDNLL